MKSSPLACHDLLSFVGALLTARDHILSMACALLLKSYLKSFLFYLLSSIPDAFWLMIISSLFSSSPLLLLMHVSLTATFVYVYHHRTTLSNLYIHVFCYVGKLLVLACSDERGRRTDIR